MHDKTFKLIILPSSTYNLGSDLMVIQKNLPWLKAGSFLKEIYYLAK